MAQHEHDRENLLRDAVALVRRVEWQSVDGREVFIGFRRSGAASVYLDQDPVYHLTSAGLLRRAFVDGCLFKADATRLVKMQRDRSGGEVQLRSQIVDAEATCVFLELMRSELSNVLRDLEDGRLRFVGQVPDEAEVKGRAIEWLRWLLDQPIEIAELPHAK